MRSFHWTGSLLLALGTSFFPVGSSAAESDTQDLTLKRHIQLSGRIVDPEGQGVGQAQITIQKADDRKALRRVASSADGRFILDLEEAGESTLAVEAFGFELFHRRVQVDGDSDLGDLTLVTLKKVGRIEGLVRRRDGSPVVEATVGLTRLGYLAPRATASSAENAVTDSGGAFRFDRIEAGSVKLVLIDVESGRYASIADVDVTVVDGETAEVVLVLRETVVRGVVRQEGSPAQGLRVSVFGDFMVSGLGLDDTPSATGDIPWSKAITNDRGEFALRVVGPLAGRVIVEGQEQDQTLFSKAVTVPDVDEFPLLLDFGGSHAKGRVLDRTTGLGIAGARVTARPVLQSDEPESGIPRLTTTGTSGAFDLDVEPGAYHLSISASGYWGASVKVDASPPETIIEDIVLLKGGTLFGRLLLPSGRPGANATVLASLDSDGSSIAFSEFDGSFVIEGLPDEPVTLNVIDAGDNVAFQRIKKIPDNQVEVQLLPSARVNVTVIGNPKDAPDATVLLGQVNGHDYMGRSRTTTDARGVVILSAPPGLLTLVAISATHTGEAVLQVQPGETVSVSIVMKARKAPPARD